LVAQAPSAAAAAKANAQQTVTEVFMVFARPGSRRQVEGDDYVEEIQQQ
jgi:hypothetical protein